MGNVARWSCSFTVLCRFGLLLTRAPEIQTEQEQSGKPFSLLRQILVPLPNVALSNMVKKQKELVRTNWTSPVWFKSTIMHWMVSEWCLTCSATWKQCYLFISSWWTYMAAHLHRCMRSSAYWHCWIYCTRPDQLLHCTCTYIKCIPLPSLCLKARWDAWVMGWGTHRLLHVTKPMHRTCQRLLWKVGRRCMLDELFWWL